MRDTHLASVDLNLLRTIQPLLEERYISRAAKRSFLSQPAMSRALDRRCGNRNVLVPGSRFGLSNGARNAFSHKPVWVARQAVEENEEIHR
jgi:hypothetical protein